MKSAARVFAGMRMLLVFSFVGPTFAGDLSNVVTYLKMEELVSGSVLDYSGQHSATVYGSPVVVPGIVGNALELTGSNHLRLPSMPLDNPLEVTVEYWIKQYSYSQFSLSGFVENPNAYPGFGISLGTFWGHGIFVNQGGVCEWTPSPNVIAYGEWYHIAITIAAGVQAKVYVNGSPLYATVWCIPGTLKDIPFFGVGARLKGSAGSPERYFNGAIDEFAIFNRVLSAEEILEHYRDGLDGIGYEGVQIPAYTCTGFKSPMHLGPVKVKKNRVLPIKTELFNSDDQEITSLEIGAIPPVIQVLYYGSTSTEPLDVTDLALAAGQGTDGNQFEFTADGLWQFNLKTSNYAAKGTYTIKIVSGDAQQYSIADGYTPARFVIE